MARTGALDYKGWLWRSGGVMTGPLTLQDGQPAVSQTGTFSGTHSGGTLSGVVVSGAAPATPTANVLYTDSVVKGWVETSGGGAWTIDADLNVSSITDNGVGDFTINWATAFADANYVVVGMGANTAGSGFFVTENPTTAKSTTAVRLLTQNNVGTTADPSVGVRILAIGNQ